MRLIKCEHCGDTSDLVTEYERIAGGQQLVTLCRDRVACWGRWDRAHGVTAPALTLADYQQAMAALKVAS